MGEQPTASHLEMSPTTNLSLLLAALFLLSLTIGMVEAKECCKEKRVGSTFYTLDHQLYSHGELPNDCLNNCVYTVAGASSPKFCFGKGDLPTECLPASTASAASVASAASAASAASTASAASATT